ncbi:MAG: HipA domain-containing protein, partial [Deltaproteobacteria bacterium]|nr:HipA domain-containing protein [Deltaproteobacteria bacterium]
MLGGISYILKFSKAEYPELAPVEYVCNKIACSCGIPVPTPFTLIEISDNELAFASKNFMQAMKTHATLVHMYRYLPVGQDNYNVETIATVIYEQTKSFKDVATFFTVLLFDALVGNHDRHGSNLALVETTRGKSLALVYDN